MLTRCAADGGGFVPWAGALVRRLFTQSARRPEALRLVGQNSKPLLQEARWPCSTLLRLARFIHFWHGLGLYRLMR
jgi:hypothetical protein